MTAAKERALAVGWASGIALLLASVLILIVGEAPLDVYRLLLAGTWGNAYGIGQVLFKATPLIFTGLSVAVALEAGLFNVGAEGQLTLGAFVTALVGAWLPAGAPALVAIPLCLVAAFVGGAIPGAVAGGLKAWRGAHEVTTTIMLNFIVRALMVGAGVRVFLRESMHTQPIVDGARLPRFARFVGALEGSAVNAALVVAIIATVALVWWIARSRVGFELRALGRSEDASRAAGIDVRRRTVLAMVIAGGLAGLGGANFVLGYKYFYEDGFSGGVGYLGIAVAVLGRMSVPGIIGAALAFATLSQGALAINALVPKEVIDVLVATTIFTVAACTPAVRRLVQKRVHA